MTDTKNAKTVDPMVCLDMQNYLHTESDCLEMWKGALQDDPGDGFSIRTMLNDIVNFCYLNKLAQQMGVSKDKLCYMLAGNYRDNDQVLHDLVKALGLSMHPTNDAVASDDGKSNDPDFTITDIELNKDKAASYSKRH